METENKHKLIKWEEMNWEPGIYENTEMSYLYEDEQGRLCFLVKLHPGSFIPMHDHPRREFAYLIKGDLILNENEVMKEGDFLTAGLAESHDVRTENGALLYVFIDYHVIRQRIVEIETTS
ncbi:MULTISPECIES: cupin domain-containing protein [Paenibacillus]|uniref:Cupin domain-containing protein n=1 Tax=Paenibacillus chitinolyticus TaxID=79263 RepID=A0A410WSH3_9BACL|nr:MULTISPECIES: cupin domain-containing protein [Paenibacillus]EGL13312.1 hypothetical protein HMPREF9413_1639 [Paenibacillus sp. HGF7]EPD82752.1 hypothetical protein HMPREF1207_03544 [Paenibacillus sp. HGH0039]MBV6713692.1 cupin domain-containing protein [Paenibacillus chitinolyticus]MCY9591230.1 cupin domain-containing protein [Paenibacillus chitinolyticus]MCY9595587.1 cupin domain-containing protein [Paenibacillus chitinolyticus]